MDAAQWDRRYEGQELLWSHRPNVFVEATVDGLPAGRGLDLAAGEGRNAVWLATRGWEVTAVDFSAVALDKGRRLAERAGVGDRVSWVQADVTGWEHPVGAFDLVVVAYLHLPPDAFEAAFGVAAGALRRRGRLVVVGHDLANLGGGVGGPQDPAVLYRAEVLADLAARHHLTVQRCERVERPTDAGVALDTLCVAVAEPGGA